jgi:hypothetical protein
MTGAYEVGLRLVELCQKGENRKAIEELYADEVDVQEAMLGGPLPNGMQSKADLLAGCDAFNAENDIHESNAHGPYPIDNTFVVFMSIELTPKSGPMAGKRFAMSEACIYSVDDGKIVKSDFAYHVPEGLGECS